MILNIVLAIVFVGSLSLFWYKVSLKIPHLVAVPDQVITQRLQEDSARLRLFLFHLRTYYREGGHKIAFWRFAGKAVYKIHLFLLRFDNRMVAVLQKIRTRGVAVNGKDNENGNFWQQLHDENSQVISQKPRAANDIRKKTAQ